MNMTKKDNKTHKYQSTYSKYKENVL